MPAPARPQEYNSPPDEQVIRFDRYQLDLRSGELLKEGRKVRLQAQPFQLLVLLLRNPGRVVSREDVRRELWPGDTFVDFDHGLAAAVNKIREALCDSADKPKFIETLPRRGYRFIGKLEPEPPLEIRPRLEEVAAPEWKAPASATATSTQTSGVSRTQAWALSAALVLLGAGVAIAVVLLLLLGQKKPELPVQEWKASQFTSYPGVTDAPSFSPDGSRIAFGLDRNNSGQGDLYVKAFGGEALLQLTHHPAKWISAAWSPDGTQIAFMRLGRAPGDDTGLYVVPALGGPEQKLLATHTPYELAAPISWSPDGKWIAYSDQPVGTNGNRIYLFSMESRESHLFFHDPACTDEGNLTFSNDDKQVAWTCVKKLDETDLLIGDPVGQSRRVVNTVRLLTTGISWAPDDSKIIMAQQGPLYSEIYEVRLSDGNMTRSPAAAGQSYANWPNVSAKTGAVAWCTWRYHMDLLRADLKNPEKPLEPILKSSRSENRASYSPDGKHIVFSSDRSGRWSIWLGDADETSLTQISRGRDNGSPQWSPDSRRVVYGENEEGTHSIHVVDVDERVPHKLLTATQDPESPFWSHDGQWIYFRDQSSSLHKFWRCPLNCNKNETLVREGPGAFTSVQWRGFTVQESEDGKYWYYTRPSDGSGDLRLFREKMIDGHLEQDEQITEIPKLNGYQSFYIVKNGIYYVSADDLTLWYFDFATRKSKQILKTERTMGFGFSVSSDGRYALLSQWGDYHQDIMLAEPKP
jgi:Tol biopolymer transport system component/DNA-binding winged helix-turn-helix (wHTH) protein